MADAKKERKRKPSALKRDQQSLKRQLINRSFKSKVSTAMRTLKASLSQKDGVSAKTSLNAINSLMDKGLKKGIYKLNKVRRVKSRLHAESQRALSV